MEPRRPVARRLHRKPLGDCTNTTTTKQRQSSSSSSSSVKFANPSLASSLKRLVHQTSLKEKQKNDVVDSSKSRPVTAHKPLSTNLRPVTRRVSADLTFPASAPPRRGNSRSGEGVGGGGGGDKEVAKPYPVYTAKRKAASGRKRSNDAASSSSAVAASLRLDLISSPGKKRRQANENTVKPSKVAPIKRQRTTKHEEDNVVHGVSQDYIEKQRAYFAEIDAFELAEEEVSSSDLD